MKTPVYGANSTSSVGTFQLNVWGLSDMHGNVWEWYMDRWHDDYEGAPSDGSAWLNGDGSRRVNRGGSWLAEADVCRSAYRDGDYRSCRNCDMGFRVCLVPSR